MNVDATITTPVIRPDYGESFSGNHGDARLTMLDRSAIVVNLEICPVRPGEGRGRHTERGERQKSS